MNPRTRRLTLMAMYAALAYILMAVTRIPITSVPFLKYDPKDVVLAICGFTLGPIPALCTAAVVTLLELVTVSTSGIIGFIMNLLASAMFVYPAASLYKRRRDLRGAILGLLIGIISATAIMLLWNYLLTPLYTKGLTREVVAGMLLPVFLPFNLVKGGLNAALAVLVYKPISRALHQSGLLLPTQNAAPAGKRARTGVLLLAALVLISCILAALAMRGII